MDSTLHICIWILMHACAQPFRLVQIYIPFLVSIFEFQQWWPTICNHANAFHEILFFQATSIIWSGSKQIDMILKFKMGSQMYCITITASMLPSHWTAAACWKWIHRRMHCVFKLSRVEGQNTKLLPSTTAQGPWLRSHIEVWVSHMHSHERKYISFTCTSTEGFYFNYSNLKVWLWFEKWGCSSDGIALV